MKTHLVLLVIAVGLVGCVPALLPDPQPSETVRRGDLLVTDSFDSVGSWRTYASEPVSMTVTDSVYRVAVQGGSYVWGIDDREHTDVIVSVTARLNSDERGNSYGVMCRADPSNDGDGYYFLVGVDGTFTIRRGSSIEVEPLIPWTRSAAVNLGATTNVIEAVCIGDYLAMYVNGRFVGETTDRLYSRGVNGVAVASLEGETLRVDFDELEVYAAWLINNSPD